MSNPRIGVIVASTRTTRFADHVLPWLGAYLDGRDDLDVTVIDLRDHPLPFYDLPASPGMAPRDYSSDEQRGLGELFDSLDGYIVITNEYNHGYSASLKNTIDHFSFEFHRKPVAFVGYGNVGGSRAIEQLRQVFAELEMVSVRHAVHLLGPSIRAIMQGADAGSALTEYEPRLTQVVDDLLWWANALRAARA
ncbi:MAG: NAD(P)H-dependent oxidoreductase [Actinomycetota bacterium]